MLGLAKLLNSADMLMNTASHRTVLIVTVQVTAETNCHSYLPKDFGDIFSHYLNISSPGSDVIFQTDEGQFSFSNSHLSSTDPSLNYSLLLKFLKGKNKLQTAFNTERSMCIA